MKLHELLQEMFKKAATEYHDMSDEELKDARKRIKTELAANETKEKHYMRRANDRMSEVMGGDPSKWDLAQNDEEYKEMIEKSRAARQGIFQLQQTNKLIYNILQTRKNTSGGMVQDYASIPEKVYVGGKSYIKNPYYNSHFHYSGPPEQFTDWKRQKPKFDELQAILARSGLAMDWMYQGLTRHHNYWPSSFVCLIKGKPFAWYKYDPGGGVGQNKIYVNGLQTQTSSFLALSPEKQDELLANL